MKIPQTNEEKIKFWKKRLKESQKRYQQLKKQSPDRWWHDEHFDNQLRVLETNIISIKEHLANLEKESKNKSP